MSKLRKLLLLPLLAAGLMPTACFGIQEVLFEDLALEETAVDLKSNPDPEIQAAGKANQEIIDEKNADFAMQRALENNELDGALRAVELKPGDPYRRLQFAALLQANGDVVNANEEFRGANDLMFFAYDFDQVERLELSLTVWLEVRDSFEPGSEAWTRLNADYCAGLAQYRVIAPQGGGKVLDTIFDIASFPDESCP